VPDSEKKEGTESQTVSEETAAPSAGESKVTPSGIPNPKQVVAAAKETAAAKKKTVVNDFKKESEAKEGEKV
jgi:hypothetical protein